MHVQSYPPVDVNGRAVITIILIFLFQSHAGPVHLINVKKSQHFYHRRRFCCRLQPACSLKFCKIPTNMIILSKITKEKGNYEITQQSDFSGGDHCAYIYRSSINEDAGTRCCSHELPLPITYHGTLLHTSSSLPSCYLRHLFGICSWSPGRAFQSQLLPCRFCFWYSFCRLSGWSTATIPYIII